MLSGAKPLHIVTELELELCLEYSASKMISRQPMIINIFSSHVCFSILASSRIKKYAHLAITTGTPFDAALAAAATLACIPPLPTLDFAPKLISFPCFSLMYVWIIFD
jgi:hypothetical protein